MRTFRITRYFMCECVWATHDLHNMYDNVYNMQRVLLGGAHASYIIIPIL